MTDYFRQSMCEKLAYTIFSAQRISRQKISRIVILNDIEVITEHSNIIIIIIDYRNFTTQFTYSTAYIYYRLHLSTFGKSQKLNPEKWTLWGENPPIFYN